MWLDKSLFQGMNSVSLPCLQLLSCEYWFEVYCCCEVEGLVLSKVHNNHVNLADVFLSKASILILSF